MITLFVFASPPGNCETNVAKGVKKTTKRKRTPPGIGFASSVNLFSHDNAPANKSVLLLWRARVLNDPIDDLSFFRAHPFERFTKKKGDGGKKKGRSTFGALRDVWVILCHLCLSLFPLCRSVACCVVFPGRRAMACLRFI